MSSYEEVDNIQKRNSVLITPSFATSIPDRIFERNDRILKLRLHNSDEKRRLRAYVTGIFPTYGNRTGFIQNNTNGVPFFDTNPKPGPPVSVNHAKCVIEVGGPGKTVDVVVPLVTSGRIYFIYDNNLEFFLTRGAYGPSIVQPSITNRSDRNYNKDWTFSEFSFNDREVYANISFVDFVSLPIAMSLKPHGQQPSHVRGFPKDGLQRLRDGLVAQKKIDRVDWDKLVVLDSTDNANHRILRVLSPGNAMDLFKAEGFLQNYFDEYAGACWGKYKNQQLIIDTQKREWGVVYGSLAGNELVFKKPSGEQIGAFRVPRTYDIFGADQGVFKAVPGPHKHLMLNIGARLDAALNRSTLHSNANQPDHDGLIETYYKHKICNHYAHWVHALTKDKKGYAFAYDDVKNGIKDQSGFLAHSNPEWLMFNVGGGEIATMATITTSAIMKRSVDLGQDLKEMPEPPPYVQNMLPRNYDLVSNHQMLHTEFTRSEPVGSEKHEFPQLLNETVLPAQSHTSRFSLPISLQDFIGKYLFWLQEYIFANLAKFFASPLGRALVPVFNFIIPMLCSISSIALRTVLSRLFILFFIILIYFFGLLPQGSELEYQRHILEGAGLLNGTFAASAAHGPALARFLALSNELQV